MVAPLGPLKQRAVDGLRAIVDDGARSVDVVGRALRGVADNADRLWLKNTLYDNAVLRLRRRFVFGDDVSAWIDAIEGAVAWPDDPLERMVVERSCPRWLVDVLVRSLGTDGADAFLVKSNQPGPVTLRANRLKNRRDTLALVLNEEGVVVVDNAVAADAVDVVGRANLTGTRAWKDGRFEVQDAGSQRVATACDVGWASRPSATVVDLCAGRGGKSLALAAARDDAGVIFVNDVDVGALADLRGRARRLGLRSIREGLPDDDSADVVLVDAPCSSLGVLRRSPDLRYTLRPADLEALVPLQKQLLKQGIAKAKAGGVVVYATCSVVDVENEGVVAGAEGVDVDGVELLLPHVHGCDGFFICRFRKR